MRGLLVKWRVSWSGIESCLIGYTGNHRDIGRRIDYKYCPKNKGWGKELHIGLFFLLKYFLILS